MYARISHLRIKSDRVDDALAYRDAIEPQMAELKGLKHWIGFMGDDGEAVVVTVYESKVDAEAALEVAGRIWGGMADMLDGQPQAKHYEVLHFKSY